jgi:hypothetical protein
MARRLLGRGPIDAVVQIGSVYWLRIPLDKLHNDRYIPLHPQLKELLDDWVAYHRSTDVRSNRLLIERNRPDTAQRVAKILRQHVADAGIGHVTTHQLRHTLATQAINRGMSLDAIAALLGHETLAMTMVYARIADKTVADEYFAVTEKVETLYDKPRKLPASDEGSEMRKLRSEMHRRMLGNRPSAGRQHLGGDGGRARDHQQGALDLGRGGLDLVDRFALVSAT